MRGLEQALVVLYFIAYPVFFLIRWLLYLLYWLASPFIFMARLTREILMLPIRAIGHFFVHFEAGYKNVLYHAMVQLISPRHSSTSFRSLLQLDFYPALSSMPLSGSQRKYSTSIESLCPVLYQQKGMMLPHTVQPGKLKERHS